MLSLGSATMIARRRYTGSANENLKRAKNRGAYVRFPQQSCQTGLTGHDNIADVSINGNAAHQLPTLLQSLNY